MARNFNEVVGTLPVFDTLSGASRFVSGYAMPRAIVQHRGRYYICTVATAHKYGKRRVPAFKRS